MKSQSAGEQYCSQSAEYNVSRTAFYNILYNISTISLFPISLLFCHKRREFFWFWELSACNGFAFIWRVAVAEMRFLLLAFGECDLEVPLFGVTE